MPDKIYRFLIFILLIFALLSALYFFLSDKIGKQIIKLSEYDITDTVTLAVNGAVREVLNSTEGSATALLTENGRVLGERTDIRYVNEFQTALAEALYKKIPNESGCLIEFPLGTLIGSGIFSGIFPTVPIKIRSVTNIDYAISDTFTSAGVNQTLHRITITLSIDLSLLLPGYEGECRVNHDVLVSETLIVGEVPYSIVTNQEKVGGQNG